MMVKWKWRKSRIIFPQENEHLVLHVNLLRYFLYLVDDSLVCVVL